MKVFASLVVAVSGVTLRSKDDTPDYGFLAGGQLPSYCMAKEITPQTAKYIETFFSPNGIQHKGTRKYSTIILQKAVECWQAILNEANICTAVTPDSLSRSADDTYKICTNNEVSAKGLETGHGKVKEINAKAWSPAEHKFFRDNYPESEVMTFLKKVAEKELMCLTMNFVDKGCNTVGTYTP